MLHLLGGRSAERNFWLMSVKDPNFNLISARSGLLTLDNSFFGLTGGLTDVHNNGENEDPNESEKEYKEWLIRYEKVSTSIKNRDQRRIEVAIEIETNIHIVGATAIEDELQDDVPETIAKLTSAGIKLWVLTGDKKKTAIEIGYSTKVLTPSMRLIEISDSSAENVKYFIAKEFMNLVKKGYLPDYQRALLEATKKSRLRHVYLFWSSFTWIISLLWELINFILRLAFQLIMFVIKFGNIEDNDGKDNIPKKRKFYDPYVTRKAVRDFAESIVNVRSKERRSSIQSDSIKSTVEEIEMVINIENDIELTPKIFNRAASARAALSIRSGSSVKEMSLKKDDDTTSMTSVLLKDDDNVDVQFLKKILRSIEKLDMSD